MIHATRQWMQGVSGLKGGYRNASAFIFGISATMTLPPFFVFPMILLAYGGLYLLVSKAPTQKRAFADGWWWGWGCYMSGLYWFCVAMMTDMSSFGWMIPFTLLGVPAFVALYPALACTLFHRLPNKGPLRRIIVFAVVWTVVEFARGHLLTGFPWNIPGNAFAYSDKAIQLASLFGAYGLTFWAVLLGASFSALAEIKVSVDKSIGFGLIVWMCFMAGMSYGEQRLLAADQVPEDDRYVPGIMLRLVQPNITQPAQWDPALQVNALQKLLHGTESSGLSQVNYVIWPEAAIPYPIRPGTPLLQLIGGILPDKTRLLSGAVRAQGDSDGHWQAWNSILMIDHKGNILATYDKAKLVPFGEFLPGRSLIPKSWPTPVGDTDFTRGPGRINVKLDGLPLARPMICYEAIFPEWGSDDPKSNDPRPEWFLNVTNDAWFGMSIGPYQHFNMARMRAAEVGIPLIRVANTGISGVIDPYGRVLSRLPLGQEGILDVKLPKPIENTINNRFNNVFLIVIMVICLLLVAI